MVERNMARIPKALLISQGKTANTFPNQYSAIPSRICHKTLLAKPDESVFIFRDPEFSIQVKANTIAI